MLGTKRIDIRASMSRGELHHFDLVTRRNMLEDATTLMLFQRADPRFERNDRAEFSGGTVSGVGQVGYT